MTRALLVAITFFACFALLAVKAEEGRLLTKELNDLKETDEHNYEERELFQDSSVTKGSDKRTIIIRPYKPLKRCSSRTPRGRCCGGNVIDDPKRKTCCRGRIVLKSMAQFLCGRKKPSSCRGFLYDPKRSKCCHGHVIPRRARCRRRRCGRRLYVTYGYHCCRGRVLRNSVKCPPRSG